MPANPYPARVLNLSLGSTSSCLTSYQNAINSARSRDSVVVVAAGNDDQDAANVSPANCNGVITVAATNRSGGKAYFYPPRASNFGATVEIAAPGGEITSLASNGVLSTLNSGTTTPSADSYEYYQGTSMAAPHVSGVAALMLSANPNLTPDNVLSIIQSTARPFPATCNQCGSGIIDAAASVAAAAPPQSNFTITVGNAYPMWGYNHWMSAGSINPSTIGSGKVLRAFYDWENYWTLESGTVVQVCGFTSNPGAGWLGSVSRGSTTKQGNQASYSYQSSGSQTGCASWAWFNGWIGIPFSGQVQVGIVHQ